MSKKKFMILLCIIQVIVILFQCCIQVAINNRRYGDQLYSGSMRMQVQFAELAWWADYLLEEFHREGVEPAEVVTWSFDNALRDATHIYPDAPMREEETVEYRVLFDRIWERILKGYGITANDNLRYQYFFVDAERAEKMAELITQLELTVKILQGFQDKYNQMSEWDRYFTCWRKERDALSGQLKLPESLAAWSDELK